MFLQIEKDSAVPISRQIDAQIRALCCAGSLRVGDRLPSVRQLARELTVNQNTVLRVYERLTADGLLEMRHGRGTFVAKHPTSRGVRDQRQKFADEWSQLVRQGRMLGLTDDEFKAMLKESLSEPAPTTGDVT